MKKRSRNESTYSMEQPTLSEDKKAKNLTRRVICVNDSNGPSPAGAADRKSFSSAYIQTEVEKENNNEDYDEEVSGFTEELCKGLQLLELNHRPLTACSSTLYSPTSFEQLPPTAFLNKMKF